MDKFTPTLECKSFKMAKKMSQKGCWNFNSWYDNEWGYSNRVVDLVRYIIKK